MSARILIGCYGSGGDLFPLVAVALALRDRGHDVQFVTPRPLGLYLRRAGLGCFAYGDASGLSAHGDDRLLSARFGGWASNHDLAERYLAPGLEADVAAVERCLDVWEPDVVVASTYAAPARIAAARRRLPLVETSIYPQYWALDGAGRRFAHRYVDEVARLLPVRCAGHWGRARTGWGVGDATLLLHEPALVPPALSSQAVGYPYWDGSWDPTLDRGGDATSGTAPAGAFDLAELAAVQRWIGGEPDVVAITLGSFIGRGRRELVRRLVTAVHATGLRSLVLNAPPGQTSGPDAVGVDDEGPGGHGRGRGNHLAVGFVPAAGVLRDVRAVVHHGGLGTSIATLRAGRPAVIIPQAFDQPVNGALLETHGAARLATPGTAADALALVLADDGWAEGARALGERLSAPGDAAVRAAVAVLEGAGDPMRVLALKPGHDGAIAFVDDGVLVYSYEAEHDSYPRHSATTAEQVLAALADAPALPDVVALGGWHKTLPGWHRDVAAGYLGLRRGTRGHGELLGHPVEVFTSTHERSHLFAGVAMSGLDPDSDIAVLVWEGVIGAWYRWAGRRCAITHRTVLDQPGARYAALFALASPEFPDTGASPASEFAGKLMALAGCADGRPPSEASRQVVDSLLSIPSLYPFYKHRYRTSGLHNCGVDDPELHRAARHLSDRLFTCFDAAARQWLPAGLPLVVAGGCGLNCDWNSRWRSGGWFAEVFVPPCADDSGSAIGTAVEASTEAGGPTTLEWSVYAGQPFVRDTVPDPSQWCARPLDAAALSARIDGGAVVAWVQGRCEIGPRSLGHRSLLGSAADPGMTARLNAIKGREPYRPIAPVCLQEDLDQHFVGGSPDPYMLSLFHVREPVLLPAVTHRDGSARVQSLPPSPERLRGLLSAHRHRTGAGVLCNTSLNFSGRGFINRTSDALHFCDRSDIDDLVIDDRWYRRARPSHAGDPTGDERLAADGPTTGVAGGLIDELRKRRHS